MNKKIIITSGLALFAMFFGAGNIIYPLELGAKSGDHIVWVTLAFLISGIGLPFLGLFATSLFQGDYWAFFRGLGKVPAFLLITFLILFIGPLFAIPRTETITYHTLQPFLPNGFNNTYVISGIYCAILFLLTFRHSNVVDIIGRILSPIKLGLFSILIVAGLLGTHTTLPNTETVLSSIQLGLAGGYSTMDLLATFFFCAIVCENILAKTQACGITDPKVIMGIFLKSCLVGGLVLGFVYIGFMMLALCHATELQGIETAQMIPTISTAVLGNMGSLFVAICVSFACIVTATALTDVSTTFVYNEIMQRKIPRIVCLLVVLATIFIMSNLGFAVIMEIADPLLKVLYPTLIIYSSIIIVLKLIEMNKSSSASVAKDTNKALVN